MARAQTNAARKPTVRDLLAQKQAPKREFTAEQLEQVRAALEHNDAEPNLKRRLSSGDVCSLLKAEYGFTLERSSLERMACQAFGRRTWATR